MTAQIQDVLALSPLQEGLFSLARIADGEADLYATQFVLEIEGPLDVAVLRRSAQAMLDRHPNLRVSFWDRDVPKPVQIVPLSAELPWHEREASAEEAEAIAYAERLKPFDLARGPAVRMLLLTLPDGRRRFVVTMHHILIDGWSLAVFCRELLAVYQHGADAGALPSVRPYRDYIGWLSQRDQASADRAWAEHVQGLAGPTLLADGRSGGQDTREVVLPQRLSFELSVEDTDRLIAWTRSENLTMSAAVHIAWAILLGRLTDRQDVVFGSVISGRPQALAGVESMVGLFVNTVPSRIRLDSCGSVRELAAQTQREAAGLREFGFVNLSKTQRQAGHGALFDTLLVYQNMPIGDATEPFVASDGAVFRPLSMESFAHYPLTIAAFPSDGKLRLLVESLPGALPVDPAVLGERLRFVLRQLPERADASPDAVEVLLPGERERALSSKPGLSDPDATVAEILWAQAARTPQALALSWSDSVLTQSSLTYGQLTEKAARLAGSLVERGVGPESVVALKLRRSPEFVIAIFAVLAAGGAYVPMDPALPQARIDSILRQAAPALVLTEEDLVFSAEPVAPVPVHPDQAAYVIFTSGSTGEPKGVVGTHRALASYAADHWDRMLRPAQERLGRKLKIAHAWSMSFDASWQPFAGLLGGHAIHLFDEEEMRDAGRLVAGIAERGVDMIDTSPSMLAQLDTGLLADEGSLAVLALGGEALSPAQWERLAALPATVAHNCYGPTETTVEAVVAAVAFSPEPVIGRATAGMAAYVLDSALRIVPDGVVGELYLSGEQLTRGYAANPGRTAERYVADPFAPGARMYRTGDLARRLPSGDLQCLGRADEQVKIRGHRIELGEVEAVLVALPDVRAAAVAPIARGASHALCACVVPQAGSALDPISLRAALAQQLPGYMVPARIVVREQLPLTANGKLDASELTLDDAVGEKPSTPAESLLATLLAEQLGAREIGVDQDFFDLGLDSITAIALVNKARRAGMAITPRMIMRTGTVRELALEAGRADASRAKADDLAPAPLLPVGRWVVEFGGFRRFSQGQLIRLPSGATREQLETVLQLLLDSHPLLRSTLVDDTLKPAPAGSVRAGDVLSVGSDVRAQARGLVDQLDPEAGVMLRAMWLPEAEAMLLVVHCLVVDPVSWQIILGELAGWWAEIEAGETPAPVVEITSYAEWSKQAPRPAADPGPEEPPLGKRRLRLGKDTMSGAQLRVETLPEAVPHAVLLDVLRAALAKWRQPVRIALEAHGRPDEPLDTSATVGLFSVISPLEPAPQVLFNYLGRIVASGNGQRPWQPIVDQTLAELARAPEPDLPLRHELALIAVTLDEGGSSADGGGSRVMLTWRWHEDIFDEAQIDELRAIWHELLRRQA